MKNPFVTLFLWELGSIVFLVIEIYRTYRESFSLQSEIDQYNYEGKLKSSDRAAREIALKNLISGLWFGSISVCILNSVIIAFEIFDPLTAIISGLIPFVCWLISKRAAKKISRVKIQGDKRFKNRVKIRVYDNLLYVSISMVTGQMAYFATQFAFEREQVVFAYSGLLSITIGLSIGILILNIGEKIVPYILKNKN